MPPHGGTCVSNPPEAPFTLRRIRPIMEPLPGDRLEAWGVLNPASARKDGDLYLFPRLVAEGNYSRIGVARVLFEHGEPAFVERLGLALQPREPFEGSRRHLGGVEDPRITWVEPLQCWVMAYVALSNIGPRVALAVSHDLFHWRRLGLLQFDPTCGVDFARYPNKDAMLFPASVQDPNGKPALALLHRPTYLVQQADFTIVREVPSGLEDDREGIWIGYISLDDARRDVETLTHVRACELLAAPEEPWEALKIGGGTPPIRISAGWLIFYHGAQGTVTNEPGTEKKVIYSAGAMVLDADRPSRVLYRSKEPVLAPEEEHEREGIVPNVVFPTAIDRRSDTRVDVYYGAADVRIAAATTEIPESLPEV